MHICLRLRILAILGCLSAFVCGTVNAQDDPAFTTAAQPFSAYHGGNIDRVDLFSGNLSIDIPLISYPQQGSKLGLTFAFHYQSGPGTDTQYCDPDTGYCYDNDTKLAHGSEIVQTGVPGLSITTTCDALNFCGYYGAAVDTPDGAVHQLGPTSTTSGPFCIQGQGCYFYGQWRALDGSGYVVTWNSSTGAATVTDPNGTQYVGVWDAGYSGNGLPVYGSIWYTTPGVPSLIKDTNGNQISTTSTIINNTFVQNTWTDSLNRPIPAAQSDAPTAADPNACPTVSGQPTVSQSWIWDLPGVNGGTYPIKFCAIQVTEDVDNYQYSTTQMQSIVLPDGTSWQFSYDNSIGLDDLSQIRFPTGGTLAYSYISGPRVCNFYDCPDHIVKTRTLDPGNGGAAGTWTYSYPPPTGNYWHYVYTTTVTDPSGNDTVHTFSSLDTESQYETEVQYYSGSSQGGGLLKKTIDTSYQYVTPFDSGSSPYARTYNSCPLDLYAVGVLPSQVTTTLNDAGQQSHSTYSYDTTSFYYPIWDGATYEGGSPWTGTLGKQLTANDYDYGGSLLKTTNTSYYYQVSSNAWLANLLAPVNSVQINDGGGTQRALTYYTYDSDGVARGNPYQAQRWLNTTGSYLTTTSAYDSYGRLSSIKDPKNNTTTYSYGSCYAGTGPTAVTNALNQTTSYCYDSNTGLQTSVTDPNSQTTSTSYDGMLRTQQITYPQQQMSDGTWINGLTTFSYPTPNEVQISERMDDHGNYKNSTLLVDGLGRKMQTQLDSDPEGTDYTDTTYDGMGRVASTSNPYRSTSDSTYGLISYAYDPLSRPQTITKQDGSTVSYSYWGNSTVVTDEAGKVRETFTDALGRLTDVWEDPSYLDYRTTYSYDALSNLIGVTQVGSRQRSFTYDSLSRLTSATNPESGTTSYSYDADGNVITKTDARGIITCYGNVTGSSCDGTGYDPLNRVTLTSYSDGTPSAFFSWDGTGRWGVNQTNTIGRLGEQWTGTSCCASGGGAEVFSYDAMGRTIFSDQYTVAMGNNGLYYAYDLLGDTLSASNGVGVTISYSYDTAARPIGVTSSLIDASHPGTLASNISYSPTGGIGKMTYGNGLTGTNVYNNRLQPCLLDVNNTNVQLSHCSDGTPNGNLLDFWMGYNEGASDNGNVVHWNATGSQSFVRTYSYDNVNRVSALSDSVGSNQCNALTWSYDDWGNRTAQSIGSGGSSCGTWSAGYSGANQITNSGFSYDAAGDLINDGLHSYFYDAENRLIQVDGTVGTCSTATACYFYDALGNRVEKQTGSDWVSYLHDPTGSAVTEWCNCTGYTGWARGYINLGGEQLAEYGDATTYFVHKDHLGSTRLITDLNGNPHDSLDFLPFGEQISGDTGSTHKFTGKERDSESNLDYFGARYYSSTFGRFMTPDWSASSDPDPVPYADLPNPQSLNLYTYTKNNPIASTDPNGHCDIDGEHHNWVWCAAHDLGITETIKEQADQARNDLAQLKNTTINGQNPQDFAKNASNQQLIATDRALGEIVANEMTESLTRACPSGVSCGVIPPFDFAVDGETVNWSATFSSEGEARAFARTKLGSDPVEVEPGKWRSKDGKWQYRAKPGDLEGDAQGPHVHLEELNPKTGQVIQNVHLRWPEGTGR